ncbi:MAG: serine acetyltransferase, partial [Prevotella sp.]|nr:serine acetyltransferase [Prevotella sp.]
MREILQNAAQEALLRNVAMLSMPLPQERELTRDIQGRMPSVDELRRVVELVKAILFPDFFDPRQADVSLRQYFVGVNMEMLYSILKVQIRRGLMFCHDARSIDNLTAVADDLAIKFIDSLHEIKRVLYTDVDAVFDSDPAVSNRGEVIFCYPVIQAMIHYRMAHCLLRLGVPVIPRIITELAHSATGIDIHPGATIGEYFSIAHGTG